MNFAQCWKWLTVKITLILAAPFLSTIIVGAVIEKYLIDKTLYVPIVRDIVIFMGFAAFVMIVELLPKEKRRNKASSPGIQEDMPGEDRSRWYKIHRFRRNPMINFILHCKWRVVKILLAAAAPLLSFEIVFYCVRNYWLFNSIHSSITREVAVLMFFCSFLTIIRLLPKDNSERQNNPL